MKRDGLLLASLPSSGSDWVASCMVDANPELRYSREFFCPTVNLPHSRELSAVLGDTLYSNVKNLCRPISAAELDHLLDSTWRQTNFNFSKENYLPFQLEAFAEKFDIVVLLRRFRDTFPPHRHRVMQWYEHFFGALITQKFIRWNVFEARHRNPMERAAIGHYFFAKQLKESAEQLGLKILWHHELMNLSAEELGGDAFAKLIVETREEIPRPSGEYFELWKPALSLYRELEQQYGPIA